MRIHTDTLTPADLAAAVKRAGLKPSNLAFTEHGSRKRARAFNVTLTGTSSRRSNPGASGASFRPRAATWDEWGMFLAHLFAIDPDAHVPGIYESGDHFRWVTGARFDTLTPADQHGRTGHRWSRYYPNITGVYFVAECTSEGCTATTRYMAHGRQFAEISGQSFRELEGV